MWIEIARNARPPVNSGWFIHDPHLRKGPSGLDLDQLKASAQTPNGGVGFTTAAKRYAKLKEQGLLSRCLDVYDLLAMQKAMSPESFEVEFAIPNDFTPKAEIQVIAWRAALAKEGENFFCALRIAKVRHEPPELVITENWFGAEIRNCVPDYIYPQYPQFS